MLPHMDCHPFINYKLTCFISVHLYITLSKNVSFIVKTTVSQTETQFILQNFIIYCRITSKQVHCGNNSLAD